MLYEKLSAEMKATVDEFVDRCRGLSWARRRTLLDQADTSLAHRFSGREANLASRGFLTAVLERLPPEEILDPDQAYLFSISLIPEHQARAEAYAEKDMVREPVATWEHEEVVPTHPVGTAGAEWARRLYARFAPARAQVAAMSEQEVDDLIAEAVAETRAARND